MNPETIKKEFEEKFGSIFGGVHLDHGVHSGFRILTELEESLLSWFLSKLSQAQAEAREELKNYIFSWTVLEVVKCEDEIGALNQRSSKNKALPKFKEYYHGYIHALKKLSSKFPPQTN